MQARATYETREDGLRVQHETAEIKCDLMDLGLVRRKEERIDDAVVSIRISILRTLKKSFKERGEAVGWVARTG